MNSDKYLLEKFTQALYDLATGEGDARSRVRVAYYRFWHIKVEDFPEKLKEKRLNIDLLLTRLPGRKGYLIPDNLARIKNKTAAKVAKIILEIYFELKEYQND